MKDTSAKVLAVITARGGSKGLPRKNLLPLAGRPLIAWTVAAARQAACVDRVIVSTDTAEIAEAARKAGAEVPFMRPPELATDSAGSIEVLRHAVKMCPGYTYLLLLQPTSPLRTAADIDAAFALMRASDARSCVSVCEVEESPWLMFCKNTAAQLERLLPEPVAGSRRQDLPTVYRLNGAIYLARTEWFLAEGCLLGRDTVGYVMPAKRSVDIDTSADFELAEQLMTADRST